MKLMKLKMILAVLVISTLIIGLACRAPQPWSTQHVYADTTASLEQEQEKIQQQLAALKSEKNQLSTQNKELQGELSWLNTRTEQERKQYTDLVEELDNAYLEMANAVLVAQEAEENVALKQDEYKKRLQIMFENRNKDTLEMLFDAKNLSAFLANIQLISIIADNDQKILSEFQAAKDDAYIKRVAAQKYTSEINVFVDAKNKEIEALKTNITQTQQQIQSIQTELQKAESDEKALLEESNKIAQEIKNLQSKTTYYGGTMVWPIPGHTYVNLKNGFGMRLHPIYKTWRMHNGVDIGAPFDAKIVAVADGKVILVRQISNYNSTKGNNYGGSGYGSYIIIDHGGGISSLYAHCKLLKVKNGDTVKAGQIIALVGSTGLSTGAHLHFEIRENGTPVNPLQKKYIGVIS